MIVNVANPPQRASRVFDSRKAASKFQDTLKRKSSTRRQSYGIAVNYFGAGKGSRVTTRGETRVRVEYDQDGKMIPVLVKAPRHKSGKGLRRWMESDGWY